MGLPLLIMLGLAGNQSAAFRDAVCDGCVSVTAPPMSAVGWMAGGPEGWRVVGAMAQLFESRRHGREGHWANGSMAKRVSAEDENGEKARAARQATWS